MSTVIMSDGEDDVPQLSAESLEALKDFYCEQALKQEKETSSVENRRSATFEEFWQLSQFWYDDKTADALSKEALRVAGCTGKIALISCPTLYNKLKKESPNCQVTLFEYDKRFAVFGEDFIHYDYNAPLDFPQHLKKSFDIVLADPPFLSVECLTKTALTIQDLAKSKIILSTGLVMEEHAKTLLNLTKAKFEPRHQNNLANEFGCFCNYNIDEHIAVQT